MSGPTPPPENEVTAAARLMLVVLGLSLGLSDIARAQLPFATGRQLGLSRSQWKLFVPSGYAPHGDDVDLLVHFHGDPQTVWNNAAYAELDAVIVTVNYSGLSSAYSTPFANASLFQQLLNDARSTLATLPDFATSTSWRRLGVSSFSAGYGAVRRILETPTYFEAIDSLLAADSLYATTASDGTALDSQLVDYKVFADRAAAGDKRFIFTHSQVPTFTYESTAETGDELLNHLGLTAQATQATGLGTLRYYREAEQGGFQLYGALGSNGDAHLSHLRYLGEWLDDLGLGDESLTADYNGDGLVDAADYTVWRDNWLSFGAPGDGDGDGFVGNTDYGVWTGQYGAGQAPESSAIPEPAAACLVALLLSVRLATRR
ncbi:hypothetical protein MalM25_10280 [Planctomycetes bacterium MalM25]|nr:hypothetical protein MalM25_10280 [Planctomycetes bacterium MalM25]